MKSTSLLFLIWQVFEDLNDRDGFNELSFWLFDQASPVKMFFWSLVDTTFTKITPG